MHSSKLFIAVAASALIAGCAPNLGARPEPRAAETLESARAFAGATGQWPAAKWWSGFGDPQLDTLIEEALAGSPDVVAAAARVRVAEGLAEQAGAALSPTLSGDGFVGGTKQSYNNGIPPAFVPKGIQDTGRLTATFRFDLDLWGKNRAALAAATSEAEAARVDAEQARLLLASNVAGAYADLQQQFAQRDVAQTALDVRNSTTELTAQRVRVGLDLLGSQRQAESRSAAARADIAALDESIALTRNRIAALLGAGPDRGLAITRPALKPLSASAPANVGIDLVGRRPDLVAARLRAEAAGKRIDVAQANFYPDISLGAVVGLQSLGLSNLLKGGSSYGNAGPAFSLPIFDGGRLRGSFVEARGRYDLAVANYDTTLITALREAADAYASLQALDTRLAEQLQALAQASEASRIAALRYRGGLSNQLNLLVAQDFELGARRSVADLEARRLTLEVALSRALGGGYISTETK